MRAAASARPGLESRPSTKDKVAMEARTASRVRGLLGMACLWAAAAPLVAQPAPADLLLTGGRVYTFAWDEPALDGTPAPNAPRSGPAFRADAEALAIRGDRIVFVGSAREAQAYRGPKTRVMDWAGPPSCPASSTRTPTSWAWARRRARSTSWTSPPRPKPSSAWPPLRKASPRASGSSDAVGTRGPGPTTTRRSSS